MFSRFSIAAFVLFALLTPTTLLGAPQKILRIAAAADLQPVLPAVIAGFGKSRGVTPEVSYASSSTLATQILNGAPYDLFLAANRAFPQKVVAAGLTVESTPVVYARGALVLWARRGVLDHRLNMQSLRDQSIQHIAVANPVHAPYGAAAMASIRTLGLEGALRSKLVFAENIAQAAQFGQSGNAECALISKTLAITPVMESAGRWTPVPETSHPPIEQGAVVMRHAAHRQAAIDFLQFVLSPAGQKILAAHGLEPASPPASTGHGKEH